MSCTRPALRLAALAVLLAPAARAEMLVGTTAPVPDAQRLFTFDEVTGGSVRSHDDPLNPLTETYEGATVGPDGRYYVTGNTLGVGAVFVFGGADGTPRPFIPFNWRPPDNKPLPTDLTAPTGLAFGPDGNLYVAGQSWPPPYHHFGPGQVLRYDGATGAPLGALITAASATLQAPTDLAFHGGSLFVADSGSVLRFDAATGAFLGTFVAPGSGGLISTSYLTFGPDGSLYLSDAAADAVRRYDGATGAPLGTFVAPGAGGLSRPQGLAFGGDGNLDVVSRANAGVLRFDGRTGAPLGAAIAPGSGLLVDPVFLAAPVPEPASLWLLAVGLGLAAGRRLRRSPPPPGARTAPCARAPR